LMETGSLWLFSLRKKSISISFSVRWALGPPYPKQARTTPPSTRSAAPLVAAASGLQT
jgi:hypothetical protein